MKIKLIDLSLTQKEKELEKRLISSENGRVAVLDGFQLDIAWELANLTRIAYSDYDIFNREKSDTKYTLTEGTLLYVSSLVTQERIDKYAVVEATLSDSENHEEIQTKIGQDYYTYEILTSYTYLAYTIVGMPPIPPIPDVDKFGFIARRIQEDGNSIIFAIFRGTRESEEWFNNFQFKQVPFLMRSPGDRSDIKISLGFNKIYTDFRPGVFMGRNLPNQISRDLDETARNASRDKYKKEHKLHKHSILKEIESCLMKYQIKDVPIYFSGHSLGGAEATISALHVAQFLDRNQLNARITLYSFASPRVGNPEFVDACNKYFATYRIANQEDLVPKVPLDKFRFLKGALANRLSNGLTSAIYDHVGNDILFEYRLGKPSNNHNMNVTYCHALRNIEK